MVWAETFTYRENSVSKMEIRGAQESACGRKKGRQAIAVDGIITSFPLLMAASFASMIGGLLIFFRKHWSEDSLMSMISIGAGLLLSITLFHMLPQVAGNTQQSLMPFVVIGYLFLFAIDLAGHGRGKADGAVIGFVIHAFSEGVSLAAAFQVSPQLGMSILVALLFHKIPEGITMASLLLAVTQRKQTAFLGSVLLGVATLAGALLAAVTERFIMTANITNPLLALSAGVFLYVSTSHLIPHIRQAKNMRAGFYFFGAVLLYMLLSTVLGPAVHHHHV